MKGRPRSFVLEDVLEKAMAVFWRHGYEGASLGRLQEATGLTPPSIYNAFGSKEGLYQACLDHYASSVGARHLATLTRPASRAGIRAYLLAAAREYTRSDSPPGCMISTASLNLSPELTSVSEATAARRAEAMSLLTSYLADAGADDPPTLARFFGAVIQGMSVQARDGASEEELAAVADVALAAWR
ncbi:TetR/AcrR family transcriptional regulator [Actinophytocola sp.]|uniref:TetR/AcrR family transcriptional regulator n=1 Tax=Actinophytocola sp. TaxID=1872138 RepID=UPI00389A7108